MKGKRQQIASSGWLFQQHAVRLYFFNRRLHYCLKFYVSKYQALFEQYDVFTAPSAIEEAAPKLQMGKKKAAKMQHQQICVYLPKFRNLACIGVRYFPEGAHQSVDYCESTRME
jgi:hypothetical protein